MSIKKNKALVRRLVEEVWNKKNLDLIPEFISLDYILYGRNGEDKGPEGHKQAQIMMNNGFPDYRINIEDLVGDGDIIAYFGTFEGTHKGEILGIKPTSKHIIVDDCAFFRIKNGKIASEKGYMDALGFLQKLGVIPQQGEQ